MRPTSVRLSSAAFSPWIVLDRMAYGWFGVGLRVIFSSNASGITAQVDHTFDNILQPTTMAGDLSRSGTSLTVNITNHGLSVGDFVSLQGFGSPFDGNYSVATVTDQNNVVVTCANTGATAASRLNGICVIARIAQNVVLNGLTASADGNYIVPPVACRLRLSAWAAGYVDLDVVPGGI